ncbi:MAG: hypothetical protein FJZ92_11245 [Chloroflexi bacterium]|nr:hypothetical protein [Chloroflexota bacterium]
MNHPGKVSLHIERPIHEAMSRALPRRDPGLPFKELPAAVERHVAADLFAGRSISWYTTTVKIDLEARGLIRRSPGPGPERLVRVR